MKAELTLSNKGRCPLFGTTACIMQRRACRRPSIDCAMVAAVDNARMYDTLQFIASTMDDPNVFKLTSADIRCILMDLTGWRGK